MTKIFAAILLIFLSINNLHSQTLSGTADFNEPKAGNHYTKVNWSLSYRFEIKEQSVKVVFYNAKVSVAPGANYYFNGKTYSKSDLGISAWPKSTLHPYNLRVSVEGTSSIGAFTSSSSCNGDGSCPDGGYIDFGKSYSIKDVVLSSLKITRFTGMDWNDESDGDAEKLISNKGNKGINSQTSITGTSSKSVLPVLPTATENNTNQIPLVPQPTNDNKLTKNFNNVNAVVGLINDISRESQERRLKKQEEQRALEEKKMAEVERVKLVEIKANKIYNREINYAKPLADSGNLIAVRLVAGSYRMLKKTDSSYFYLLKAAEMGDNESISSLVKEFYAKKESPYWNREKLMYWIRTGANNGNLQCQYALAEIVEGFFPDGTIILLDDSLKKEYGKNISKTKAIELYEQIAKAGDEKYSVMALQTISRIYESGYGDVKKDKTKSKLYLKRMDSLAMHLGEKFVIYGEARDKDNHFYFTRNFTCYTEYGKKHEQMEVAAELIKQLLLKRGLEYPSTTRDEMVESSILTHKSYGLNHVINTIKDLDFAFDKRPK